MVVVVVEARVLFAVSKDDYVLNIFFASYHRPKLIWASLQLTQINTFVNTFKQLHTKHTHAHSFKCLFPFLFAILLRFNNTPWLVVFGILGFRFHLVFLSACGRHFTRQFGSTANIGTWYQVSHFPRPIVGLYINFVY